MYYLICFCQTVVINSYKQRMHIAIWVAQIYNIHEFTIQTCFSWYNEVPIEKAELINTHNP